MRLVHVDGSWPSTFLHEMTRPPWLTLLGYKKSIVIHG